MNLKKQLPVFLTFYLLFIDFFTAYGQARAIDNPGNKLSFHNVAQILFPGDYNTAELKGMSIFYMNTESLSFQVITSVETINDAADPKGFLDGVKKGYIQSVKDNGMACSQKDSLVNNIPVKVIHATGNKNQIAISELYAFLFSVAGRPYTIQVMVQNTLTDEDRKKIALFFSSLVVTREG